MVGRKIGVAAFALFAAMCFCIPAYGGTGKSAHINVTSSAFQEGGMIPERYSFYNENISPPLSWSGVPDGTRSVAVICDDPDAPRGTWVHWVIFNIPASAGGLPEDIGREEVLADGSAQGVNDFKKTGYDGPAPPHGVHRYFFTVFVLDTKLELQAGATKGDLVSAMAGHVIGEGKLMGRFEKEN